MKVRFKTEGGAAIRKTFWQTSPHPEHKIMLKDSKLMLYRR